MLTACFLTVLDKHDWKHYLPTTYLASSKNVIFENKYGSRPKTEFTKNLDNMARTCVKKDVAVKPRVFALFVVWQWM